jgi:acetyltransferase
MKGLSFLLNPQSVAVVGASPDSTKLNGLALEYLLKHDFQGRIYPVNPKYPEIRGLKCYPSVDDLPEGIDAAEILVSRERVLEVIRQCARKEVKSAIVFSSGFGEIGSKGTQAQNKMTSIAKSSGMILHGPNCNGIVNFLQRIPLSFTPILECKNLRVGNIGLISQSGGLGSHLLLKIYKNYANNFGCSYYIGTGNEAANTFEDYLKFLVNDEYTEVIACIIETFRKGKAFLRIAEEAFNKKKPIVLFKLAVSDLGKKVALSHTAAVGGEQSVTNSILRQKGVVVVDTLEDLMNGCLLLSKFKEIEGFRLGVVTDSGGMASLAADLCEKLGLRLPSLKTPSAKEITELMSFGNPRNPLDLTGQSVSDIGYFASALNSFYKNPDFDVISMVLSGDTPEEIENQVDEVANLAKLYKKPTLVSYEVVPNKEAEKNLIDKLKDSDIPFFTSIASCFRASSCVSQHVAFHSGKSPFDKRFSSKLTNQKYRELQAIARQNDEFILEPHGTRLLETFGIPLAPGRFVTSLQQALKAAEDIGYPVAVKAISASIPHKTEAGAICLHVQNNAELQKAYKQVIAATKKFEPNAELDGLLVQQMIKSEIEFAMGFYHSNEFGPVVAFGLGGIYVEVFRDIAFRSAPLRTCDAEEMITELRCYNILKGTRGRGKLAIGSIIPALVNLSEFAIATSKYISELDLNPIYVFPEGRGVLAIDYLIKRKTRKDFTKGSLTS